MCLSQLPSSNKRPTGAPLILQNFSLHAEKTFLRFSVGTSSPWIGSKNRESANPIAYCVAVFSPEPSSRIWKRHNFFAISSWRVLIGSNLLNSHSWLCLSSASFCVRKSSSFTGRWLAVSITNLDSSSVARTQRFWISFESHALKPKIHLV